MAKQQRKERKQKPQESTTSTTMLKIFFAVSFIVLGLFVFNDVPINWILGVFAIDIVASLAYVMKNRMRALESKVVHTNIRIILAYLIMIITMFFYAFALWRVGQYTTQMQITLFVGGAIIYAAVYNSTSTLLQKK